MDTHLIHSYLEIIQHNAERIACLEAEVERLQEENRSLKNELNLRGRVYINEMHGTVQGDAYQRSSN